MKKEVGRISTIKKAQVSVFIIIAIIIVVFGALIYMFYPKIQTTLGLGGEENPYSFMQNCLEDSLTKNVEKISSQGGSLNPEFYFKYKDEKLEYLCYTNEYYKTCVVQHPMLKNHIENEIKNSIQEEVDGCFNSLKKSYEKRGYQVLLKPGTTEVELLPKRISVRFGHELDLTDSSSNSKKYENFNINLNNNLYELVSIANSIINWEANYGDSETTVYMNYYHDLKVEKLKQNDGTTVYILTNRDKGNKFQFASRSVAWPPGI